MEFIFDRGESASPTGKAFLTAANLHKSVQGLERAKGIEPSS